MAVVYLGIGSNLGRRRQNINLALEKIKKIKSTWLIKVAPIIETMPEGGPKGQRKYLNTVVKIKTMLKPLRLLNELKKIEKQMGRVSGARNGPRIIDLDILLYGDKIINNKSLKVPHPRMFAREFVLKPLSVLV